MKNQPLLYAVIGLFAGIFLTLVLTSTGANSDYYGVAGMMGINQGGRSSASSSLDRHFIEQMIPHHEGAIEMAELAQERSKRPEILALAGSIIKSQSAEITQMETWYEDLYGIRVPVDSTVGMGMGRGMMHGGMMGESADIELLRTATNFDKAFLEEMIPHHQMAVMMAQMLLAGTERPEMKQLGQDIITAQEAEIDQMRSWLSEMR